MVSSKELLRDFVLALAATATSLLYAPIALMGAMVNVFRKCGKNTFRSVVITGASSGIGECLAKVCAESGVGNMLLVGRNAARLKDVADRCKLMGANVETVVLDFVNDGALKSLINTVRDFDNRFPVDCVFSVAGMSAQNAEPSVSDEDIFSSEFIHSMTNVNYLAMTAMATCLLDRFRARKRGHITLVSSINGMIGPAQQIIYNSNKAAVLSFARDLRVLLEDEGVGVTVVCPGFTQHTNMTEPQFVNEGAKWPRMMSGDPETLAKKVLDGSRCNSYMIAYPMDHFLLTHVAASLPPSFSTFYSKVMKKSKLISPRGS